jgi:hypothetical protein
MFLSQPGPGRVQGAVGLDAGVDADVGLVVVDDLVAAVAVEVEDRGAGDLGGVVLGDRGPQVESLLSLGVEEIDGVAGRAGDADVADAVAVEVGDVGGAAAAGLGDGGRRDRAGLAVET